MFRGGGFWFFGCRFQGRTKSEAAIGKLDLERFGVFGFGLGRCNRAITADHGIAAFERFLVAQCFTQPIKGFKLALAIGLIGFGAYDKAFGQRGEAFCLSFKIAGGAGLAQTDRLLIEPGFLVCGSTREAWCQASAKVLNTAVVIFEAPCERGGAQRARSFG